MGNKTTELLRSGNALLESQKGMLPETPAPPKRKPTVKDRIKQGLSYLNEVAALGKKKATDVPQDLKEIESLIRGRKPVGKKEG